MKEKRDTQRDINVLLQLCDDIDICNGHRVLVIDSLIIVFAAFNRHEEVNLCVDVCVCVCTLSSFILFVQGDNGNYAAITITRVTMTITDTHTHTHKHTQLKHTIGPGTSISVPAIVVLWLERCVPSFLNESTETEWASRDQ